MLHILTNSYLFCVVIHAMPILRFVSLEKLCGLE